MADQTLSASGYARRHIRFGWWSLLLFLALGLGLELLHGFKARMYLDVSNETRRLMWTLAHAHGGLLGLVHVVFGLSLKIQSESAPRQLAAISISLLGASVFLPGGFFLGGMTFYGGDPGLGILLVPVGAALLIAGVFGIARASAKIDKTPHGAERSTSRRKKS